MASSYLFNVAPAYIFGGNGLPGQTNEPQFYDFKKWTVSDFEKYYGTQRHTYDILKRMNTFGLYDYNNDTDTQRSWGTEKQELAKDKVALEYKKKYPNTDTYFDHLAPWMLVAAIEQHYINPSKAPPEVDPEIHPEFWHF